MHCAIHVILAASGILLSKPHRMIAQHPARTEPIAVVRSAFRAYEAKQWSEFAAHVHADALAELRSQQLGVAEVWEALS
jgi:hypothetical protein